MIQAIGSAMQITSNPYCGTNTVQTKVRAIISRTPANIARLVWPRLCTVGLQTLRIASVQ